MHRFLFIPIIFALSGCGGSEDAGGNGGNSNSGNTGNNGVQSINAQDMIKFLKPATPATLSLANYIELSSPTSNLRLRDVTPVLNESSPDYCSEYYTEGVTISINPTDVIGECVYLYTAEADGVTAEPSLMRVVFSNGETGPIRLAETTSIGQKVSIDLSRYIPAGYSLDTDSLLLLGAGTVRAVADADNEIEYTAGQSDGDAGVSRILVNMKSDTDNKVVIATIDVAVSEIGSNHAPLAFNFKYGDTITFVPGVQLEYQPVALGEEIVIDIAPYFNKGYLGSNDQKIEMKNDKGQYFYDENGDQINFYLEANGYTTTEVYRSGLTLVDPDKHPVQLIDVYSYNASVSPVQMDGEYTSTKFSFKSLMPGLNYVTYVLSDHNGGYATGIIEIRVLKEGSIVSKPWKSRLNTPDGKYLAPVDYATAIAENIRISGYTNEDGIDGPLGASTALFNYDEARYFCDKQGMELPTDSDIYYLKKNFPQGLYKSLDAYSETESSRNQKIGWPVTNHYWVQVPSNFSYVQVVSLVDYSRKNYDLSDYGNLQMAGAVCISRYKIASYRIINNSNNIYNAWASRLPHDSQYLRVIVNIVDYYGKPAYIKQALRTSQADHVRVYPIGKTNIDGDATVLLKSLVVEKNEKIRLISGLDVVDVEGLEFRDIPNYVRPKDNITTTDGRTTLCYYSSIDEMAAGINCNMSSSSTGDGFNFYTLSWRGLVTDSFFFDGKSAYRVWNNVIYNTQGFWGAALGPDYTDRYNILGAYTVSRTDPFNSKNPMLYDGQYYWVVNESKRKIEAYSRIVDLSRQQNMVKSVSMLGTSVNEAFVYDPIEKVYWRLNSYIPGKAAHLRSYKTIEDAASQANFIKEIPFSSTGGRTFTVVK
ncbi:TPA: hypothetical protein ACRTTK_003059 [Aeromonas hydrophila]